MRPGRVNGRAVVVLATALGLALPGAAFAQQAETDARIAAVERGLPLALQVEGRLEGPFSLEDRMRHYGVPGVSVAVVDGGRVAWARGYGVAEAGSDRAVSTETLFQAASISKPVAALAALRLVERGALALDEDVNRRLRAWRVPASDEANGQPVTLRGLLTHSAGLTVHGFRGYAADEAVPGVTEVLAGSGPANSAPVVVDLEPGTEWRYSGGGYTVAQLLMEEVGGQPFHALMRELVLEPLGMRASTYRQPLPEALQAHAATGHRSDGQPIPGRYHIYPERAAAGLWTTPSDLARFIIGVQRARAGKDGAVLGWDMAEAMLTPGIGGWGLGPGLESSGQLLRFRHGGANAGFRAFFVGFAERGQGVAVMTNSDAGSRLAQEIVLAVAREYDWPEVEPRVVTPLALAPAELERYAGMYEAPEREGFEVRAFVRDGAVFVDLPGSDAATELVPVETDVFLMLGSGQRVVFERDDAGAITGIRQPLRLVRLPESPRRRDPVDLGSAGVQRHISLSDLAFMSGCWRADLTGGAALEEFYTAPSDNLILGTSRYLRGGRAVQHEFSRITADSAGIVLLPFPGGQPSEHGFRLTRLEDGSALFEAPQHDFPKRIRYSRGADGSLSARIDGGEGDDQAREWRMRAVPCRPAAGPRP